MVVCHLPREIDREVVDMSMVRVVVTGTLADITVQITTEIEKEVTTEIDINIIAQTTSKTRNIHLLTKKMEDTDPRTTISIFNRIAHNKSSSIIMATRLGS